MLMTNATEVRKEWSSIIDGVVHDKPIFIKRTRDKMWLSNLSIMKDILSVVKYTAERFVEEDGSVTLSLNEIELIENAPTEALARVGLGNAILNYSNDFYEDFSYWSKAPNRKQHIPYVFKALLADDAEIIGDEIICLDGKN
ncbi:MAG: hypothetical protein PHQ72_05400 [Hespellia sp.]|nr:hypothetical protein [Hespellia sp.]